MPDQNDNSALSQPETASSSAASDTLTYEHFYMGYFGERNEFGDSIAEPESYQRTVPIAQPKPGRVITGHVCRSQIQHAGGNYMIVQDSAPCALRTDVRATPRTKVMLVTVELDPRISLAGSAWEVHVWGDLSGWRLVEGQHMALFTRPAALWLREVKRITEHLAAHRLESRRKLEDLQQQRNQVNPEGKFMLSLKDALALAQMRLLTTKWKVARDAFLQSNQNITSLIKALHHVTLARKAAKKCLPWWDYWPSVAPESLLEQNHLESRLQAAKCQRQQAFESFCSMRLAAREPRRRAEIHTLAKDLIATDHRLHAEIQDLTKVEAAQSHQLSEGIRLAIRLKELQQHPVTMECSAVAARQGQVLPKPTDPRLFVSPAQNRSERQRL